MLTHYEDMKSNKNAKIGVVWEIGVPHDYWQHSHSLERI